LVNLYKNRKEKAIYKRRNKQNIQKHRIHKIGKNIKTNKQTQKNF